MAINPEATPQTTSNAPPDPSHQPNPSSSLQTLGALATFPGPTVPSQISFDPKFYPHLFDRIFSHLDTKAMISMRAVCKYLRDDVEPLLARHIVMKKFDRRVFPAIARQPLKRFPKTNFWSSSKLKTSVSIVDIDSSSWRGLPESFRRLPAVQVVRDLSGSCQSEVPAPRTMEWISWHTGSPFSGVIPNVVTERVILVLKDWPGDFWAYTLPDGPIEIVTIIDGYWWAPEHDLWSYFDSDDSSHRCPCCCPSWAGCDGACDECMETYNRMRDFLQDLAEAAADRILTDPARDGQTTFTMVGFEDMFEAAFIEDETFVDLVAELGCIQDTDAAKHIKLSTHQDYREDVGQDRYNLYTERGY